MLTQRTCAACGKPIRRADICNSCFHKWCPGGIYPEWLKALCTIQSSFERSKANAEVVFTDLGRDLPGEKEDSDTLDF